MKEAINTAKQWWAKKSYKQKHSFLSNSLGVMLLVFFLSLLANTTIQTMMLLLVSANLVAIVFLARKNHKAEEKRFVKEFIESKMETEEKPLKESERVRVNEIIKSMESQFESSKKDED